VPWSPGRRREQLRESVNTNESVVVTRMPGPTGSNPPRIARREAGPLDGQPGVGWCEVAPDKAHDADLRDLRASRSRHVCDVAIWDGPSRCCPNDVVTLATALHWAALQDLDELPGR
jgi:hypothetical protein